MIFDKLESGFWLRLKRGEPVVESLTRFAKEQEITAAGISGIGAVTGASLGYFDLTRREYNRKKFDGVYELLNLAGNISLVDGNPFVHAHVIVAGPDYQTLGGHLFEAEVAVTVEIILRVFPQAVSRKFDPDINLNLWNLSSCLE